MKQNIREVVGRVLNEQRFLRFIAKYGDDFFKKMFSSPRVKKATIQKLEDVFNNPNNLGKLKNGEEIIKLKPQKVGNVVTNPFVKLSEIQDDLDKLHNKLITKDDILKKYGNKILQDGTSVSDIFLPKFQEQLKTNLKLRLKPTFDKIDLKQAFKDGWTSQLPTSSALKYFANKVTFGNTFKRLSKDDRKRALAWWLAGVGDGPGVWKIFKDNYSITDKFFLALCNSGGQLAKKWLVLSGALTLLNAFFDSLNDKNEQVYEKNWSGVLERIYTNAVLVDPFMVSPAYFLAKNIITPFAAGGWGKDFTQENFMKSLNETNLKLREQLSSVEDLLQSEVNRYKSKKSIPKNKELDSTAVRTDNTRVKTPVDTNTTAPNF